MKIGQYSSVSIILFIVPKIFTRGVINQLKNHNQAGAFRGEPT